MADPKDVLGLIKDTGAEVVDIFLDEVCQASIKRELQRHTVFDVVIGKHEPVIFAETSRFDQVLTEADRAQIAKTDRAGRQHCDGYRNLSRDGCFDLGMFLGPPRLRDKGMRQVHDTRPYVPIEHLSDQRLVFRCEPGLPMGLKLDL